MFVNFSNHPSRYWDNKQREASQYYGELFDMPFPQIAPNASDEELLILAQDCVDKIASLGDSKSITVHIMGEMTFCYKLITKLKAHNIRCLASTTKRETVEENGVKISKFNFVRFREY